MGANDYRHRTEVVGPIVTFGGGPREPGDYSPTFRTVYQVPRDTLDPRYEACTDHHVACDCREAELHEDLREYSMRQGEIEDAFVQLLSGHRAMSCMCTGCQIARKVGISYKIPEPDDEVPF